MPRSRCWVAVNPGQHFGAIMLRLDGLVTLQINLPLLTATLALQLGLEVIEVAHKIRRFC